MTFDEYMGFTWKNIHSSAYHCFIVNDKNNLKIINSPNFSNEYVQPMFGDKNYLLGTKSTYKNLSFQICVHDITLPEYREFLKWLDTKSIGDLYLDYDSDYGYTVKLSSLSESTRYPLGRNSKQELLFHAELNISFDTVDDSNAHGKIYNLVNLNADYNYTTTITQSDTTYITDRYDKNGHTIVQTVINNSKTTNTTLTALPEMKDSYTVISQYNNFSVNNDKNKISSYSPLEIVLNNEGDIDVPFQLYMSNFIGTIIVTDITNDTDIEVLNLTLNIDDECDINHRCKAGFEYNSDTGLITWCGKLLNNLEFHNNTISTEKYGRIHYLSTGNSTLKFTITCANNIAWDMTIGYESKVSII